MLNLCYDWPDNKGMSQRSINVFLPSMTWISSTNTVFISFPTVAWKISNPRALGRVLCHLLHSCLFLWHFLDLYFWFSRWVAITIWVFPGQDHTSAAQLGASVLCPWHFDISSFVRSFFCCRNTIGIISSEHVQGNHKLPENGDLELDLNTTNQRNHGSV